MIKTYSTFQLKAFDESSGEFEGVASTPSTDRMGDVVEPKGAKFTLPMPLLWQHRGDEPIGLVTWAKVTAAGIAVKGKIEKDLLPRIAEAWTLIRAGLVRGLSIGFLPLDSEPLDKEHPWGPQRFTSWDWMELSAVTIPANAEANIQTIKSYDDQQRAALGASAVVRLKSPGAAGTKSIQTGEARMKTIGEQTAGFDAQRKTLVEKNQALMDTAAEEDRTLSESEKETYDTAAAEMKSIDEHLVRLRDHETAAMAKATPVTQDGTGTPDRATQTRQGQPVMLMGKNNLPKGTAFTRYAIALAATRGQKWEAAEFAKRWKDTTPEVELTLRAAIAAGDSVTSGWASQLVYQENMASEFIELLRPMTIIGRIPGLRRVPFNVRMPRATAGTSANWVGQGLPKPLSKMTFDTVSLTYHKIAAMVVLTEELVRLSNPAAEAVVQADMLAAVSQYMDQQFIDPTITASGTTSPASVTNGATSHAMTGTAIANIDTDVSTVFADFSTANISLTSAVWVMHPRSARYIGMLRTTNGVFAYPGIDQNGGTFFGVPVVTSNSVPIDTGADTYIFLINASDILVADEGGVSVDVSREASVQMDDAPSTGAQSLVSFWQNNLIGLRAERYITWARRRDEAVSILEDVTY